MAVYLWEGRKFYEYYRIAQQDEDDDADEFGSGIAEESKSHMEGSHSLWGIIWSIQKETGWTQQYVLWGESWMNIQMKIADAPRMVSGSKVRGFSTDEELIKFLSE